MSTTTKTRYAKPKAFPRSSGWPRPNALKPGDRLVPRDERSDLMMGTVETAGEHTGYTVRWDDGTRSESREGTHDGLIGPDGLSETHRIARPLAEDAI